MHACKHLAVYGGLCTRASTCVCVCVCVCVEDYARVQVPVCGGDSLQEVHVHQGAGKVEGVSQLVSEVNKLQYLNRGEEMIDTQTHEQTHKHTNTGILYIHVL